MQEIVHLNEPHIYILLLGLQDQDASDDKSDANIENRADKKLSKERFKIKRLADSVFLQQS